MGFLHYTHAMLQNCLREDMYGQRFLTVWGQVSFKKETECSGSSGNLLSFTIVTMLSGTVASGVSFCLSTFVSCFLFAFCKLAANGLPVGFAEGTCCFCMVSKAATCTPLGKVTEIVDFGQYSVYSTLALKFVLRNSFLLRRRLPWSCANLTITDERLRVTCMHVTWTRWWLKWRIVPNPYVHKSPFSPFG